MIGLMGFLLGLLFLAVVIGAFLLLVKAILGMPQLAGLGPYTRVIYALVVFVVALALYQSYATYPTLWSIPVRP